MKLVNIKEWSGSIVLKSGLHIGAGDMEMKIGGTDNSVIKHPYTQEPYIPGSSIKGKVRSLLEMRTGLMAKTNGAPLSLKDLNGLEGQPKIECEKILKLFGSSGADMDESGSIGPARASFADCPLDTDWKDESLKLHRPFYEVKSENTINRIKGTAEHPRFIERVPADTKFTFCITLRQMETDAKLEDFLLQGLKLLELDRLGGSGSRGYGQITFHFDDAETQAKYDQIIPF